MSFIFATIYMYLTVVWNRSYNKESKLPRIRTLIGYTVLIIMAIVTGTPEGLAVFGLISMGFHINKNIWNPFHSGMFAAVSTGIIITLVMSITGDDPVTYINNGTHQTSIMLLSSFVGAGVTIHTIHNEPNIGFSGRSIPSYNNLINKENESQNRSDENKPRSSSKKEQEQEQNNNKTKNASNNQSENIENMETKNKNTSVTGKQNKQQIEHDQLRTDDETNNENQEGNEEITEYAFPWEEPPDLRFSDIGGYNEIKRELEDQIVKPAVQRTESFDRFNIEPSKGILFHGPPGTGKTMFARALANSLDIPFVELTQADLTHEHINKSPQIIQRLFEEAQEVGGVVFIDEAEQLLGDRGNNSVSHNEDRKITNTFLSNLTREDQNFIVLLTTNRRDTMDEAILRPGRIDEQFEIGYPNLEARVEILKVKLANIPSSVTEQELYALNEHTENWSGADLNALFNQAKYNAAERNAEKLQAYDLKVGYKKTKESLNNNKR